MKNKITPFINNKLALIISFILITIFCITWESVFSFRVPNELRIDKSGLLSSIYFSSKALYGTTSYQLGIDYIFPYGPLLFWKYYIFWPGLYWIGLLFKIIFFLSYSISIVELFKRKNNLNFFSILPIVLTTIWLSIHAGNMTGSEGIYYSYIIMLGFIFLGNKNEINQINIILLAFSLVLLSLSKFTFLLMSLIFITIILLDNHKEKKNLLFTILYLLIFLFAWKVLAKQEIFNFPHYFFISLNYATYFSNGMSLGWLNFHPFTAGITSIILIYLVWILTNKSEYYHSNKYLILFLLVITFLIFKHGFVRADGHITHFASPMIFTFILLLTLFKKEVKNIKFIYLKNKSIIQIKYLLYLPILLCFFMINYYAPIISTKHSKDTYIKHIYGTLKNQLTKPMGIFSYNNQNTKLFYSQVENLKNSVDMEVPKGKSVDAWPDNAALAIFSEGIYSPRPHPYAFSAYSKKLTDINTNFMKSNKAPEYLFFEVRTMDNHLFSNDDPSTLLEIFKQYQIKLEDKKRFLLEKRIHPKKLTIISSGKIDSRVFDEVKLPETNNILLVNLKIEKNIFGKLINFIYKLPQLQLITFNQYGNEKRFRFISGMGKIIISPQILNNNDAKYFFDRKLNLSNLNQTKKIRLMHTLYRDNPTLKFMSLFYKKKMILEYDEVLLK